MEALLEIVRVEGWAGQRRKGEGRKGREEGRGETNVVEGASGVVGGG